MRTTSISSAQFTPGSPPSDPKELQRYLIDLEVRIAAAIAALAAGHLDVLHVAPAKPREVDYRVADGVNWNPGGGKGLYAYSGGVWTLIQALP